MNDRRDERELEAYLAGNSPVSRQYAELPDAQPPTELDARILAAAEAEVKVVPIGRPWQRWAAAVGVAATVMLAFTLVMQVAIKPFGQSETTPPPAAIVLMEEAEVRERERREEKEAPLSVRPLDRVDAPAAPPGRMADDAARELLRDELVPAEMQPGLAGMEARVPVVPSLNAPQPEAFAGAPMQAGEPVVITEARLADAVELIRASRTDSPMRAKSVDVDGVASDALAAVTPEEQLDEVLRLYEAGDHIGAATRLDEFRAAHPEHPVSLSLADALN